MAALVAAPAVATNLLLADLVDTLNDGCGLTALRRRAQDVATSCPEPAGFASRMPSAYGHYLETYEKQGDAWLLKTTDITTRIRVEAV